MKRLLLLVCPAILAAPLNISIINTNSSHGSYSVVHIEDAIFINTYKQSHLSEVKLLWANGRYFTKRGGLILSMKTDNVAPEFRNLSKKEAEALNGSETKIRLYKDSKGDYNIETLASY